MNALKISPKRYSQKLIGLAVVENQKEEIQTRMIVGKKKGKTCKNLLSEATQIVYENGCKGWVALEQVK